MYKYNWKDSGEKKIEYTTRKTEMANKCEVPGRQNEILCKGEVGQLCY